uniref:Uncharacterized protein n=1 Tax=Arundo donax TaxID=35708 RepID=A0A0A9ER92_ARUDO
MGSNCILKLSLHALLCFYGFGSRMKQHNTVGTSFCFLFYVVMYNLSVF